MKLDKIETLGAVLIHANSVHIFANPQLYIKPMQYDAILKPLQNKNVIICGIFCQSYSFLVLTFYGWECFTDSGQRSSPYYLVTGSAKYRLNHYNIIVLTHLCVVVQSK